MQPINPGLHEAELYTAYMEAPDDRDWTCLFDDQPRGEGDFHSYLIRLERSHDPLHFAIVESQSREALGTAALMRIDPKRGRSLPPD